MHAITLLQGAGYIAEALKVASTCYEHDSYINIQLHKRDPPQYDEVLGYLAYLPFVLTSIHDIILLLKKYGRILLKHRPHIFTVLLIKLCTGNIITIKIN